MTQRFDDEAFKGASIEFRSGVRIPLEPGLFEEFNARVSEFVTDPEVKSVLYETLLRKLAEDGKLPRVIIEVPYMTSGVDITSRNIIDGLNLPVNNDEVTE
jgi:hypothetical protein